MLFINLSLIAALELRINQIQKDTVEAIVRNEKDVPVAILLPNTPFSRMKEDSLQVVQKGKRVKFVGQHVQWDYEKVNSFYKTIQPGEIWTHNIDVSKIYNTVDGEAKVKLSFIYRECDFKDGKVFSCQLPVILQSEDILMKVKTHQRFKDLVPNYRTKNCWFLKWIKAKYAIRKYQQMQDAAIMDLKNGPSLAFEEYFGTNDTSAVLDTFLKAKSYKFDLECGSSECTMDGIYAFVSPEQPTIFVCNQFYKTDYSGYNSKPGVLIHESTHFRATGDTEDYAYGFLEARKLAIDNPDLAVKNADNYEYYAERVFYKLKE